MKGSNDVSRKRAPKLPPTACEIANHHWQHGVGGSGELLIYEADLGFSVQWTHRLSSAMDDLLQLNEAT